MESLFLFFDLLIAYILDLLVGDPKKLPHPVRYIGRLIRKLEKMLLKNGEKSHDAKTRSPKQEVLKGAMLLILTTLIVGGVIFLVLALARAISQNFFENNILFHIVNTYLLFTALATKCLADEAHKVSLELKQNGLSGGRKQVSYLVSRDTSELDEEGVVRATFETVAENTVDGSISPMFFAFLGIFFGIPAVFTYVFKAVSTLDSMVGYKNEKYMNFGKFSARADDVLNYLPARITGFLVALVAPLAGGSMINSFRIFLRDRKKHKSPNAGHAEAAFAGAFGVSVGGGGFYFGSWVSKEVIGDGNRKIDKDDINKATKLLYLTSGIAFFMFSYIMMCLIK